MAGWGSPTLSTWIWKKLLQTGGSLLQQCTSPASQNGASIELHNICKCSQITILKGDLHVFAGQIQTTLTLLYFLRMATPLTSKPWIVSNNMTQKYSVNLDCFIVATVYFIVPAASWSSTAESNVYKRGQVVNLQVSAKTRPEQPQQLFIQSCFVSASPEPQTRRRHAVIMNKG